MTPLEALKQQSAVQRWERIKSQYGAPLVAPATANPAGLSAKLPHGTAPNLPLPEELEAAAVAPLPGDADDPRWVIPSRPIDDIVEEPAPRVEMVARSRAAVPNAPVAARSTQSAFIPVETVPVDSQSATEAPAAFPPAETVATNLLPPAPVARITPTAGQDNPMPPMPLGAPTAKRRLRTLQEISPYYDTSVDKDIREFADRRAADYSVEFGTKAFEPRMFPDTMMAWEASNFYHFPLYFEDPALERYGHTRPFLVQPVLSSARFAAQVILLPYQMTIDPVCKPIYSLGWYRPGDVAPKLKYQIPWNTQAAMVEAGVVTGLFFLIP